MRISTQGNKDDIFNDDPSLFGATPYECVLIGGQHERLYRLNRKVESMSKGFGVLNTSGPWTLPRRVRAALLPPQLLGAKEGLANRTTNPFGEASLALFCEQPSDSRIGIPVQPLSSVVRVLWLP